MKRVGSRDADGLYLGIQEQIFDRAIGARNSVLLGERLGSLDDDVGDRDDPSVRLLDVRGDVRILRDATRANDADTDLIRHRCSFPHHRIRMACRYIDRATLLADGSLSLEDEQAQLHGVLDRLPWYNVCISLTFRG